MERHDNDIFNSVLDIFNGENGPIYAAITAIVALVGFRYGYKLKGQAANIEVSCEPSADKDNEDIVLVEDTTIDN